MTESNPSSSLALSPVAHAAAASDVWRRRDACLLYGEAHVRAQVAGRRWVAPVPSVIVGHNGPLTPKQRVWVALLAAPKGAVLGGLSAAEQDGFRGFEPTEISLVIPGHARKPRRREFASPEEWNIKVRWSTKLSPVDVRLNAFPPRTRLARSIVDAASEPISARRSRVIVLASVQQRLIRPPDLSEVLSRRGRCRHRRLIAESIIDATGGIESLPEHEFETLRKRLGLPKPARQRAVRHSGGRYYLDNDWPELGIRVEIHGIPHREIQNWDHDLLRQNELNIAGGGLLVYSSYAIRRVQHRVGHQLFAMFLSRGWRAGVP